jgi:SAM-dependent methyltransferase
MDNPLPLQESPDACPLCGAGGHTVVATGVRDYEYGTRGEYRWLRCDGCRVVRLDPFPSPETLERAYPPTYHAYVQPQSSLSRWLIGRARVATARALAAHLPGDGVVLDVGCSNGLLLADIGMRGAYRLLGVEYSPAMAAQARRRGIDVWCGELADAPFTSQSVDLVVMQHVLEHVSDPIEGLIRIARLLKPGGRVVGEVPNLDSWDARLFGATWGGGHAPRHLWHFTPATLTRALESTGFAHIAIRPSLHTGHWALSIQNWLRRNRESTEGLRSGRAWYFPILLLAFLPINVLQMPSLATGVMRFEAVRA